jgi:hypothetical protein
MAERTVTGALATKLRWLVNVHDHRLATDLASAVVQSTLDVDLDAIDSAERRWVWRLLPRADACTDEFDLRIG